MIFPLEKLTIKERIAEKKNTILCGGWHLNCFSWCFLHNKKDAQKKIEGAGKRGMKKIIIWREL